jgi:hypothetical protein
VRIRYDRKEGEGLLPQGDERMLRNSNLCSMGLTRNTLMMRIYLILSTYES